MDERTYSYLKAIIDNGSISEAANKLYITQPALSQFIKRIEEKFGIELFERDFRPLRLTESGKVFMESLEKIKMIEKNTVDVIQEMNNLKRGSLTIGTSYYRTYYFLPPIIKRYMKRYPGIDIKLIEENTAILESLAQKGETDFSFGYLPVNLPNLDSFRLYEEEVFIATSRNHRLVKENNIQFPQKLPFPVIDVKELKNDSVIMMKKGQQLRKHFIELEKLMDAKLNVILETDNMWTAQKLTSEDIGITILPCEMALRSKDPLAYFQTSPPLSKRTAIIYYSSLYPLKKSAVKFIELMREYIETFYSENNID
ncbi:LysR family transcriptional regulator [Garciella nitratireducens]|uniref:DNA-binding transcriptional regulator, LysR family n=1 Tax=Garciella nitratireducens DSM 15102 TaxID=1121911 RepID=A0A1T4L114_9FIRM|nr:LysR family transcriptional regulator [Garciella nitratireducens]SJZ48395.1 DNA-binding transcriptional regulator, LysR family [Garciella nitratireducens DSM 15102]